MLLGDLKGNMKFLSSRESKIWEKLEMSKLELTRYTQFSSLFCALGWNCALRERILLIILCFCLVREFYSRYLNLFISYFYLREEVSSTCTYLCFDGIEELWVNEQESRAMFWRGPVCLLFLQIKYLPPKNTF